jgi:hypothetical protein
MKLTVHGEPRTKKTHNETFLVGFGKHGAGVRRWLQGIISLPEKHLVRAVLSRCRVGPSKQYRKWLKDAPFTLHPPIDPLPLLAQPWHCKATFFRARRTGDLLGYEQALADWLQDKNLSSTRGVKLHVLPDDKWIESWDGSRLEIDREKPRVEVELTPHGGTIDLLEGTDE